MKDQFTKNWIINNSMEIVEKYEKGILTLRALHYQLVGRGMTNDIQHYKRAVMAMIDARWAGLIAFDTFSDLDREMVGETKYEETTVESKLETSKHVINYYLDTYYKNKWENQPIYAEVFIEKKALQGVFQNMCNKYDIALGACKGYPSLTFLHESALRFKEAIELGKEVVILYFGDYDPSGEDIPRSIAQNMYRFGVHVQVRRIALMEHQVTGWQLPPAPAKLTDSRTANWDGLGQVELDAVTPHRLMSLCERSILSVFDLDRYESLKIQQAIEKKEYQKQLKEWMKSIDLD